MIGMTDIEPRTKEAIDRMLRLVLRYIKYDIDTIEDILLFTKRRTDYPNIDSDSVASSSATYLADNIYWIFVCMLVNADFRACFDDAITIEKALLEVTDVDYQDFRDDMTLDDTLETETLVPIDLMAYNDRVEMFFNGRVNNAKSAFYNAGMSDVYDDLAKDLDPKSAADIDHIVRCMVYVINAFNRNGVFRKYVMLVVDSVKKQLS